MPLEFLIGSRVTLAAGIVSLLLGAAFFIEFTNAQHPIPPEVRVLCGLVAGLGLMAGGAWSMRRARLLFGEAITGLGASLAYLSLWGAFGPLHVVSEPLAFAGMVAVSAALAAIGWTCRSEMVALVGLAGAAATPVLLATAQLDHATLSAYVVLLCAAQLLLVSRCGFRRLEIAALAVAVLYAPAFFPAGNWTTVHGLVACTALYGIFAAAFFFNAQRDWSERRGRAALWVAQTLAYLAAIECLLWHWTILHALSDALAGAALLGIAAAAGGRTIRTASVVLGLAAITRATGVWAGNAAMFELFALQALVFFYLGVRQAERGQRTAGYVLAALAASGCVYHLAVDAIAHPVFNSTTALAAAVTVMCALMVRDVRGYAALFEKQEGEAVLVTASLGAALFAVAACSVNVVAATTHSGVWTTQTQTALSAVWTLAATALIAWGFGSRNVVLRYAGLALFAVTAFKVMAFDVWPALDTLGRVISCSLLGGILIAVAGAYQFAIARGRRAT